MSKEQRNELNLKIILIGDAGVGKSSILLRYKTNEFLDIYNATIGIDNIFKDIVVDGINIRLQVLDTAGQERYHSIIPSYIRKANGIFLVFDLTQKSSFEHLDYWMDFIKNEKDVNGKNLIILANKKDLEEIREVNDEDINEFIKKHGYFQKIEISVKNKDEIAQAFDEMIKLLLANIPKEELENIKKEMKLNNNTNKKKRCCK